MPWWRRHAEPAVAPSLLAADFLCLREELDRLAAAGADLFHLDVMDAHFVPNLTFGPVVVKAIRRGTDLPLDAHLMMSEPERYLDAFLACGVEAVTIHGEIAGDVPDALRRIRDGGAHPGISLNPDTELAVIEPVLEMVDLVLVMSVPPGFGGQAFRPVALEKLRTLRRWRRERGLEFALSVDGGVNDRTAPDCVAAGADILVSGSYLVRAPDPAAAVAALRGGAGAAAP